MFAFAESIKHVDAYMIGFQLLAAGGPFVFISSLPVSQLWPDKKVKTKTKKQGAEREREEERREARGKRSKERRERGKKRRGRLPDRGEEKRNKFTIIFIPFPRR